jgi:protein-L-isoaspartate(D-aspartate) O-methyltransferase
MNVRAAEPREFSLERHQMVERQIERRGIREPRLLAAFEKVPRHLFVPEELRYAAYDDCALPIGFGQTISQPYIVALMASLLELEGGERVLEVGTGSGYQAAILSRLAGEVYTIEFIPELAARAEKLLGELGYGNVHVRIGDGSLGYAEAAPYAGIIVAASAPEAPRPLLEQLTDRGRLVLPAGSRGFQLLEVWKRRGDEYDRQTVTGVAFVPLRGKYGWGAG